MENRSKWIHVGNLEALKQDGVKIVRGGIAVFYHEERVAAVDNRCPHLGFPLHMGSLCDGILTCHWHHARFDVLSGGTLDPWADDVPSYKVKVENGDVWVSSAPKREDSIQKYKDRLREGLEQNIGIVIAKAVVGLVEGGVPETDIAKIGIAFGTAHGNGWNAGLTILTAMVNILPKLDNNGRILALYHGLLHVARSSAGQSARHLLGPLPDADVPLERLAEWYRNCVEVRDTQGAEKVLLTAIEKGVALEPLAEMMLTAATDHFYLDEGHVFDFHNKALESLEWMGAEHAKSVLASLVPMMRRPARSEELHHWKSPVDVVEPIRQAIRELENGALQPEIPLADLDEGRILEQLLSDRPLETIQWIKESLMRGVQPAHLAQLVALAAAERVVRFHTQNDFGDWIAVLHTFTHAHAVHERLKRSKEPLLRRAIFYGAVSVYHDRFLNVPAASRPKERDRSFASRPEELLDLLDRRQQVDPAAQWVFDYVGSGGGIEPLFHTLGYALLREDADFHSFQMVEAAFAEYDGWQVRTDSFAQKAQEMMLLACVRYLAAHAPTARELPHIAQIAGRLHRGERLFEAD